jgi:uncharacterized membrane protein
VGIARRERSLIAVGSALALPVALAIGAANFFWQLGSSSYYVDEALSINDSLLSLHTIVTTVNTVEINPPTYFLGLHEWIYRTGSQAEWVLRFPSALAGIALIAAVYWVASLLVNRTAAGIAALITALSPLVLEYAQQVRVYAFVMLIATLAVGATVTAVRATRGQVWWWLIAGVAAALTPWLHYTGALVVGPLCVWLATRPTVSTRAKAAFIGACVVAMLALIPIFVDQLRANPSGAMGIPGLTWTTLTRLIETPFDGRTLEGVDAARLVGAAVVVVSVGVLVVAGRRQRLPNWQLLGSLAVAAPLAVIGLSAVGTHVALTRYTAVAAPFLIIVIAAAITTGPRVLGLGILVGAVAVAGIGLARSHQRSGFYGDARGVISYIQSHQAPGDVVLTPGGAGTDVPLAYYAQRRLHPLPSYVSARNRAVVGAAVAQRRRLVSIVELPRVVSRAALTAAVDRVIAPWRYRVQGVSIFPSTVPFAIVFAVPRS